MSKRLAALLFTLLIVSNSYAFADQSLLSNRSSNNEVIFSMGDWCPYHGTCKEGDGYITEMLREVFSREQIKATFIPLPWTRAMRLTQEGVYDGVMSPGGQALEFYYPKESTGSFAYCYYTKKTEKWNYTGVGSLTLRLTAYIKDSTMIEDKEFLENPDNSAYFYPVPYTKNYMMQVVRMLKHDRVNTIVNDPNVTKSFLKSNPEFEHYLRNAGCIGRSSLWVGLSLHPSKLSKSRHIADIIGRGITTLRNDGTLKKILDKYGLKDWQ